MTVQELQRLLKALLSNGTILPHSEVAIVVNEDFSEIDYLDPDGPDYRNDNPHGRLWLCGTNDEAQTTAWTLAGEEVQPYQSLHPERSPACLFCHEKSTRNW